MILQYHRDTDDEAIKTSQKLKKYGISVDFQTGLINYLTQKSPKLLCNSLYFLRHADTIGTLEHRFMSDESANSILIPEGKEKLSFTAKKIDDIYLDMILYSDIPRVKETAEILFMFMEKAIPYVKLSWMKGIDNKGWEGRHPDELSGIDREDYVRREVVHDIFAKSKEGTSWGTVLVTAIQLLEYLNVQCQDKSVLIVSQGSLLYALQMVLRLEEPWHSYSTQEFYNLVPTSRALYGQMQAIKFNNKYV